MCESMASSQDSLLSLSDSEDELSVALQVSLMGEEEDASEVARAERRKFLDNRKRKARAEEMKAVAKMKRRGFTREKPVKLDSDIL